MARTSLAKTGVLHQLLIVFHVIDAGKPVLLVSEQLPVLFFGQHVGVGVDPGSIQVVQGDQGIAHLIAGVGQLQPDLLCAFGDAPQADRKAVAGQDGEHYAEFPRREFGADVRCDVVHAHVVALGSCHDCFRHGDHVPVFQVLAAIRRCENAVRNDLDDVVSLADDGRSYASGYGSDRSFHKTHASLWSLFRQIN